MAEKGRNVWDADQLGWSVCEASRHHGLKYVDNPIVFFNSKLKCENAEIAGILGEPVRQFLERGHGG